MSAKIGGDAGHGGTNTGTSDNGFVEKDVVLDIAFKLKRLVEAMGLTYVMSRVTDERLTLKARASRLESCDLTFVLHINALLKQVGETECECEDDCGGECARPIMEDDPAGHGVMVFYRASDDGAKQMAEHIAARAPHKMRRQRIAIEAKPGNWTKNAYNTIKHHRGTAFCVEMGFRTNPDDRRRLLTQATQWALAVMLAAGVVRFLELHGEMDV